MILTNIEIFEIIVKSKLQNIANSLSFLELWPQKRNLLNEFIKINDGDFEHVFGCIGNYVEEL